MFFYLKVNRNEGYSVRNLRHWLDIVLLPGSNNSFVVLCDNDLLKTRLIDNIPILNESFFIPSNRTESKLTEITKHNTSEFWNNAAFSHLTTFYDAEIRGLEEFYNIDADDTCFCAKPESVNKILMCAREEANRQQIDAFSFDMSHSRRGGAFWTFGVTYVDNKKDWFKYIMDHCYDNYLDLPEYDEMRLPSCIDTYFSYINKCSDLKLESFYVENCKFIHYSNDFVYRPWSSWFATYKEGKIIKPLLGEFFELKNMGEVNIASDVLKIDIGLTTQEQLEWLINYACEAERNKKILIDSLNSCFCEVKV